MLRWSLVGLVVLGLLVAWSTSSPGLLALALLGIFVCGFGALLAFAAERIAERSRPDSAMLSPEELGAIGARGAARKDDAAAPPGDATR